MQSAAKSPILCEACAVESKLRARPQGRTVPFFLRGRYVAGAACSR